jgi:hypothetical protein
MNIRHKYIEIHRINLLFWLRLNNYMEKQSFLKRNQFNILAIAVFLVLCFVYFAPVLEGKVIRQDDVESLKGGFTEIRDYKAATGRYALWSNAMFSGMPTYQMWLGYPSNVAGHILDLYYRALPNPVHTVFLYLIGFFILLRTLRMNVWLSILGAIAFAFSSYNFIIIAAGHTNKAIVIGLFAPTIAGVLMAYRGKFIQGAALTALALALQIRANHYQMSYYLAIAIGIYALITFYYSVREKTIGNFLKASLALVAAAVIAIGVNLTPILLTEEYAHETIRGKSELTLDSSANNNGLSKTYAFEYSYGITESISLLVPNVQGGASVGELSKDSETFKYLQRNGVQGASQIIKQLPLYWGDQSSTAGPVYFGAIIIFLFVLGLFIVKGKEKWWIAISVTLILMLSWGKNFEALSYLFFDYFPMYNKFRAVSSILTVASLLVPLLACLALRDILEGKISKDDFFKGLRNSFAIVGGLTLILAIMPGIVGSFINESRDRSVFGQSYEQLINVIASDREGLLRVDAFRSFIFVLISAALLFFFNRDKIKGNILIIALAALVLLDMWGIDKRYLNDARFAKAKKVEVENPSPADQQIMLDTDLYYRVYNVTGNPFTDAGTSRFHKSIGGYHAAKMKKYQELIENQISKGNMSVLSMLNTKYFIVADQNSGQTFPQVNPGACGNAWFINEIKYVANADSEMLALTNFNPLKTVFIDQRYQEKVQAITGSDSTAKIQLTYYSPDTLKYTSNNSMDGFAVFSDIYYEKGWKAFVDGKEMPHVRVNYVLRGMNIPAGKHEIEFRFEPAKYYLGEKVSLASSILLVLLLATSVFVTIRKK